MENTQECPHCKNTGRQLKSEDNKELYQSLKDVLSLIELNKQLKLTHQENKILLGARNTIRSSEEICTTCDGEGKVTETVFNFYKNQYEK